MTDVKAITTRIRGFWRLSGLTAGLAAGLMAAGSLPALAAEAHAAPMPDGYQQSLLIYSTLSALDQANTTGNYAVLRGLAAPDFQRINPAAALATVFAKYRERHVVLAPVVLYQPKLIEEPRIGEDGLLHLKGYFPTKPLRIGFDLVFQSVDGTWRLMALSIAPSQG